MKIRMLALTKPSDEPAWVIDDLESFVTLGAPKARANFACASEVPGQQPCRKRGC